MIIPQNLHAELKNFGNEIGKQVYNEFNFFLIYALYININQPCNTTKQKHFFLKTFTWELNEM